MYVCIRTQSCPTLCNPTDCSPPGSMGFSRQEYWSGLPCPPPGDLPDSGIEFASLASPELAGELFTISAIWEAQTGHYQVFIIKTSHWVPCLEKHCWSVVQHLRCLSESPTGPTPRVHVSNKLLGAAVTAGLGTSFENHCSEAISSHHYFLAPFSTQSHLLSKSRRNAQEADPEGTSQRLSSPGDSWVPG